MGTTLLSSGSLNTSAGLGTISTMDEDGFRYEINNPLNGTTAGVVRNIVINAPVPGQIIKLQVDETTSNSIVRAGTRLEVMFA